MKVLASNETMEFVKLAHDEGTRTQFMTHNRQMLDLRGDWTMRLLSSWGMAGAMGDILTKYGCAEHATALPQKVPPQELVMRICEVVDAAWNEMRHRGWILDTGTIGD